jgi:hypothetical protein
MKNPLNTCPKAFNEAPKWRSCPSIRNFLPTFLMTSNIISSFIMRFYFIGDLSQSAHMSLCILTKLWKESFKLLMLGWLWSATEWSLTLLLAWRSSVSKIRSIWFLGFFQPKGQDWARNWIFFRIGIAGWFNLRIVPFHISCIKDLS